MMKINTIMINRALDAVMLKNTTIALCHEDGMSAQAINSLITHLNTRIQYIYSDLTHSHNALRTYLHSVHTIDKELKNELRKIL